MSATIEHLGKLAADLRDAIEKGTEPTKSLKRKHEEAEYADRKAGWVHEAEEKHWK